jgi:16S rRNA processing protein RimM
VLSHRGVEREVQGARGRQTAKGVIATLPGVADRDAAEALAGAEIFVARSQLPPPAPGEYYWVDLEGLAVVNLEGVVLGTVSHLLNTGANDILSVAGDRERLVPFIEGDFVKSVDFDTRTITVDWDADF